VRYQKCTSPPPAPLGGFSTDSPPSSTRLGEARIGQWRNHSLSFRFYLGNMRSETAIPLSAYTDVGERSLPKEDRKWPLGLSMVLAAAVSVGLWIGLIAAGRAVISAITG